MKGNRAMHFMSENLQIILLVLVLAFVSTTANAQGDSEVLFKDGTSITGKVKQIIPDSILIIEVANQELTFPYKRVRSINRTKISRFGFYNPIMLQPIGWERYSGSSLKDTGLYVNGNFMLSFFGVGMDLAVGQQINRFLGVGGYSGLHMQADQQIRYIPVGLEIRGRLQEGTRSAFYFGRGGYNFPDRDNATNVKGGLHATLGIGMQYKRSDFHAVQWSLAFSRTDVSYDRNEVIDWRGQSTQIHEALRMHRLEFRMGYLF